MPPHRMDWTRLLCADRLERLAPERKTRGRPNWYVDSRDEVERDYDRILYSASTRRLGDKTQVFPLDRTDTVRNRLTHSHEVSSLARSIGTHLVHSPFVERMLTDCPDARCEEGRRNLMRAVPAVLAAAGLAHDIGNPPFGHEGEATIRAWFADRGHVEGLKDEAEQCKSDFLRFEGNAQALRALTRLQVVRDDRGLNLTFATLATILKYTVPSHRTDAGRIEARKHGFFASEAGLVEVVRAKCGLCDDVRHPLTNVVEACDDIAYLVADAEDAVKKRVTSFSDLVAWLEHDEVRGRRGSAENKLIRWLVRKGKEDMKAAREARVPPREVSDVAMQLFRAEAITAMVSAVINGFVESYDALMTGGSAAGLLSGGPAGKLAERLRAFDKAHAYKDRAVLRLELSGHNVLTELMDMLWTGIASRKGASDPDHEPATPFSRYAFERISENYKRVFEASGTAARSHDRVMSTRYRELQLLADMISGMTDRFALELHADLKAVHARAAHA